MTKDFTWEGKNKLDEIIEFQKIMLYNKNKDLIAWRSTYTRTNTQIIKINRQIKFIEAQKNLSERERYEKVKQLNLLKAEIVRTLKNNVLAYEKTNDTRVKRPIWWK